MDTGVDTFGSGLRLQFLGTPSVLRDGQPVPLPPSRKTRALLAYLALTGRPHRREHLCSLLWELPDDPRAALRWSLSKLRALIDDSDRRRILADRETVSFDSAGADVDIPRIRAEVKAGLGRLDLPALRALDAAFVGEALEGLDFDEQPGFRAWCAQLREDVRHLRMRVLDALVERLQARPEEAVPYARLLADLAPLDPLRQLSLLRLLDGAGRRNEAEEAVTMMHTRLHETDPVGASALLDAWRSSRAPIRLAPRGPEREPAERQSAQAAESPGPVPVMERKQVTVLRARLVSQPPIDDVDDPEYAFDHLSPAWERVVAAAEHQGGTAGNVQGDSITVLFGAPRALEGHAFRACAAAQAIREALAGPEAEDLDLRIGIHSGEVVAGSTTRGSTGNYGAIGPAVTVAGQLLNSASRGQILISEESRRQAGMHVSAGGGMSVETTPGRSILACSLEGITNERGRWTARAARGLTTFLGREFELAALDRMADRTEGGRGGVFAIVGEPGLGKSRLAHEFAQHCLRRGWRYLEASAIPGDVDTAFGPVVALFRTWFGIEETDDERATARKIEAALSTIDPALADAAPTLRYLLGLSPPAGRWDGAEAERWRQQALDWIKAILTRFGRNEPVLLVFDDLQWIDGESQAVLDAVVDGIGAGRLLLLATYRPEYQHGWGDKSVYSMLRLEPLAAASVDDLLASLLGRDHSLAPLVADLKARAQGNPFFLEEMVRSLVEAGSLSGDTGAYRLVEPIDRFRLPVSVHAVLAARMDRLSSSARELLQIASVVGQDVPLPLLRSVASMPEEQLRLALAQLTAAEFLFETQVFPDTTLAFKHALTHDVAYGSLLRETRRRLHRELVETIERLSAGRLEEHAERLAHHALAAADVGKAITYLAMSAENAARRAALGKAIAHYRRALDLLTELTDRNSADRLELDLLLSLGPCLLAANGYASPAAGETYERARALCDRLNDQDHAFAALYGHWVYHWNGGELTAAHAIAVDMLKRSAAQRSRQRTLLAHRGVGLTLTGLGRFGEAATHLEQVREVYDPIEDRNLALLFAQDPWIAASGFLALDLWPLGRGDSAKAVIAELLDYADTLGHPFSLAYAHFCAATAGLVGEDATACLDHGARCLDTALAHGYPVFRAFGRVLRGAGAIGPDTLQQAIADIREGIADCEANGITVWRPLWLAALARALRLAGDDEAALAAVDEGLQRADVRGETYALSDLCRLKGDLLAARPAESAEDARAWLGRAVAVADAQGAPWWKLRAATSLWRSPRCDPDALAGCLAGFTECRDHPSFLDAQSLLPR